VRESHYLHQTIEIVVEITAKFRERDLLIPQYAIDEYMRRKQYHPMLRDDIRSW